MLYDVSRLRKTKSTCFILYVEDRSKTKTYIQKQTWSYTNQYIEHVCYSETTLWDLGENGEEKRMIDHQPYHKT
jgi:hypothetical protein